MERMPNTDGEVREKRVNETESELGALAAIALNTGPISDHPGDRIPEDNPSDSYSEDEDDSAASDEGEDVIDDEDDDQGTDVVYNRVESRESEDGGNAEKSDTVIADTSLSGEENKPHECIENVQQQSSNDGEKISAEEEENKHENITDTKRSGDSDVKSDSEVTHFFGAGLNLAHVDAVEKPVMSGQKAAKDVSETDDLGDLCKTEAGNSLIFGNSGKAGTSVVSQLPGSQNGTYKQTVTPQRQVMKVPGKRGRPRKNNKPLVDLALYTNKSHGSNLLMKLLEQRETKKNCDVIFQVKDEEFVGHSCVISACTSYFDEDFKQNHSHKSQGLVEIVMSNTNPDVFECVLHYMYSGEIALEFSLALDILRLNDFLQIPDLTGHCCGHLKKRTAPYNVVQILQVAEEYDLDDLYEQAVKVVNSQLKDPSEIPRIQTISSEAVKSILSYCAHKKAPILEYEKLKFLIHWVAHKVEERYKLFDGLSGYIFTSIIPKSAAEEIPLLEEVVNTKLAEHPVIINLPDMVGSQERPGRKRKVSEEMPVYERKTRKVQPRGSLNEDVLSEAAELRIEITDKIRSVPVKKRLYQPTEDTSSVNTSSSWSKPQRSPPKKQGRPVKYTRLKGSDRDKLSSETQDDEDNVDVERDYEVALNEAGIEIQYKRINFCGRTFYVDTFEDCLYKARDLTRLEDHISIKHRGVNRHPCKICHKAFSSSHHLLRHMKIHNQEKTELCDFCEYSTTRKDSLRCHVRRVHPEQAYKLGYLKQKEYDKMLEQLEEQKNREPKSGNKKDKTPENGEVFSCSKCKKRFFSPNSLQAHMKGHGTEDPLLCEHCGFSTKHYASMRLHRLNHSGQEPHYKCPEEGCTYGTFRKSRLQDHISRHRGISNFFCSICGKGFVTRKHMTRHEKNHSSIKEFACNECSYSSTRSDKYKEHIRNRHPDTAVSMGIITQEEIEKSKSEPRRMLKRVTRNNKKKVESRHAAAAPVSTAHTQAQQMAAYTEPQPAQQQPAMCVSQPGLTQPISSHYSTMSEEVMAYFSHYEADGQGHSSATHVGSTVAALAAQTGAEVIAQSGGAVPHSAPTPVAALPGMAAQLGMRMLGPHGMPPHEQLGTMAAQLGHSRHGSTAIANLLQQNQVIHPQ